MNYRIYTINVSSLEQKFSQIKNLILLFRFAAINTTSEIYFTNANEMSLKFAKWSVWTVVGSYIFSTLTYASVGAIFYYIRDGFVDPVNLYLPYKIRCLRTNSNFQFRTSLTIEFPLISRENSLPFDESTWLGWFCSLMLELLCGTTYVSTSVTITSLFIGLGLFFRASTLHFEAIFNEMNDTLTGCLSTERDLLLKLKRSLINAIKYHNRAKE